MERSDRYLLKRYEKIHWYFVCKLEYRFSRILTREEPIWGLKRVFKRSTVFKHSSRSVDVILWRIRLLVFVTLVTWSKLVEHSAILVSGPCSTIWRSEVFSVHVCKYWSLFVLTLGFLCCDILLEPYVNAWCLCILRTIACGVLVEWKWHWPPCWNSRLPIIRTFKGKRKKFELSGFRVIEGKIIQKMIWRETKITSS